MLKKIPSESGFNATDTDDSKDLITGISMSREKSIIPSSKNMENTTEGKSWEKNDITQPFFFNDDIIGQKYVESAKLPGLTYTYGTKIVWERTQNVLELPILGHFRTYEKRVERSRPNPWRRHGALLKIYEIGGWISKMEKQQVSRRNRKYFYVKAGSKPCNQPLRPPISIRESKFLPPSSVSIPSTTSRTVDELAYVAAIHIQKAIQNSVSIFLESQKIGTTERNKIIIENGYSIGKMNLAERSSSAQRLSARSALPLGTGSRSRSLSLLGRKRR
ncbi:Scytalone dehydratase-like protein [Dirofilaria immitis]